MTPEELARQSIDRQLDACGWAVQDRKAMNIYAALGVAVREFPLDDGEGAKVPDWELDERGIPEPAEDAALTIPLAIIQPQRPVSSALCSSAYMIEAMPSIKKNTITAFIGPAGCGKSTVLRCLNRMNDLVRGFRFKGHASIAARTSMSRRLTPSPYGVTSAWCSNNSCLRLP